MGEWSRSWEQPERPCKDVTTPKRWWNMKWRVFLFKQYPKKTECAIKDAQNNELILTAAYQQEVSVMFFLADGWDHLKFGQIEQAQQNQGLSYCVDQAAQKLNGETYVATDPVCEFEPKPRLSILMKRIPLSCPCCKFLESIAALMQLLLEPLLLAFWVLLRAWKYFIRISMVCITWVRGSVRKIRFTYDRKCCLTPECKSCSYFISELWKNGTHNQPKSLSVRNGYFNCRTTGIRTSNQFKMRRV